MQDCQNRERDPSARSGSLRISPAGSDARKTAQIAKIGNCNSLKRHREKKTLQGRAQPTVSLQNLLQTRRVGVG